MGETVAWNGEKWSRCASLIETNPHRLSAVIAAIGATTKY